MTKMKKIFFILAVITVIVTFVPGARAQAQDRSLAGDPAFSICFGGIFSIMPTYPGRVEEGLAIAELAESYVGKIDYDLIGGDSSLSKGICDCSGFVYRIYEAAGYKKSYKSYATCADIMKRTTEDGNNFYEIAKDEMLPGDIIIYENSEKYQKENPGKVFGHAAIYAGNGMVIHVTRNDRGYTGCVKTALNYRNIKDETRIHVVRVDLSNS